MTLSRRSGLGREKSSLGDLTELQVLFQRPDTPLRIDKELEFCRALIVAVVSDA
jgi:hypothetical protein